uniref:G_PROTEIN_RECEP_F2_4 domain-containing protein n=1 Tax=Caenorhabditis tropicalis TaxID=1561998 RepID=A0A1I7U406_9PELO
MRLFILLVLLVKQSYSPSGTRFNCDKHNDDFEFCEKQSSKCYRETNMNCTTKYCDCLKDIKVESTCKEYVVDLCEDAKKLHPKKIITEENLMKDLVIMKKLVAPVNELREYCYNGSQFDVEFNNVKDRKMAALGDFSKMKIATAIVLNDLFSRPNKSTHCKRATDSFQTVILEMNEETFSQMPISFDNWHCGWSLGYTARLILRATAIISTPNRILSFNHCCAIQRNCYFINTTKTICDENFEKCLQDTVNSDEDEKSGTTVFQKIIQELHSWNSDVAYDNSHLMGIGIKLKFYRYSFLEYEYMTFSTNDEQSMKDLNSLYNTNTSINHCCAEHLNCYMEQNGKETCDTSLSNCYKKAISPMTSYKLSCESLFNNSSGEFEDKDYEAFQVSKIHTEIETFDGEENQEIQVSDIVNFTITRIKVFRLSSNGLVDSNIREKFNRNFYKYGWPKRVIIDSCAMIFEECRRYENMNICFKKLQICLDDIEEKSEEFQVTLKEFNLMVSSRIQNATPEETIKSIEEIKKIIKKLKEDIEILESNQFPLWASYLTLIVEICFIFYTIVKCFLKTWEKKKLRMDPLVPVESGESLVRYNASSQQAVIEHDGTE